MHTKNNNNLMLITNELFLRKIKGRSNSAFSKSVNLLKIEIIKENMKISVCELEQGQKPSGNPSEHPQSPCRPP